MSEIGFWTGEVIAQIETLKAGLRPFWDSLKGFGNSAFTTSLAGAFAGAYAAQRIAAKSKVRDELIKEIRNTNAGLILALTITNLALAIKRQHVQNLKNSYDDDVRNANAHLLGVRNGTIDPKAPLILSMNFISLQGISPPIESLREIVLAKLSTHGRALAAVTALADGITNLNDALRRRNDLIADYKAKKLPEGAGIHELYLGLQYDEGHVNSEYGNTVQGIYLYVNDVIFFGMKLCEDLREHGGRVVKNNKKTLKNAPSDLVEIDFKPAKDLGLIPNEDEYMSWTSGMQVKPKPKPWWNKIIKFA